MVRYDEDSKGSSGGAEDKVLALERSREGKTMLIRNVFMVS